MHIGKNRVAAACAALLAFGALSALADAPVVVAPGAQQDGDRRDHDRHDRDWDHHDRDHHDYDYSGPISLGMVQMAPESTFFLNAAPSTIVSIIAAPLYGGQVVVTASGMLCVGHTAGADDSAMLQIMVDNVPSGSAQQIAIPKTQKDGQMCSSFNLTGGVTPVLAQSHAIRLVGQASGASTYVSGASLSAMLYPDMGYPGPAYRDYPRR